MPLHMEVIETPTCNISKAFGMGKVLQKCKLIVWDECTMAHNESLEALNRSLQDLRGNIRPFGNASVLLAGDFRQTVPVIPRYKSVDTVKETDEAVNYPTECLNSLDLPWIPSHVRPLKICVLIIILQNINQL
ncbi:ATP-dependent DNA helicase pif1-like [Procambarus clarkii]|uniref:ATP-dependent DNA helicase pif1-like n=1 Tax=Procambarus clarkii TaxID=6728 RepID=UPI003742ACF6